MNVDAPAKDPVVMFVGTDKRKTGVRDLFKRLVGATGRLVVLSALMCIFQASGQPGDADDEPRILELLSIPGFEFLLGGVSILGVVVLWWAWNG